MPKRLLRHLTATCNYDKLAYSFKKNILTLVGAYPCGRPVGQAQGRAPTQKHYLKNYRLKVKNSSDINVDPHNCTAQEPSYRAGHDVWIEGVGIPSFGLTAGSRPAESAFFIRFHK